MPDHYKENSKPKLEFTKIVIAGVLILYYITALYGFIYITWLGTKEVYDYSMSAFKALLAFIEIPIPIAIGFYCWKARGENIPKQYQRMLDDIKDPQLKAIFLQSIAGGNLANLDLTKNKMGKQYNDMAINEEENVLAQCKNGIYEDEDSFVYTDDSVG